MWPVSTLEVVIANEVLGFVGVGPALPPEKPQSPLPRKRLFQPDIGMANHSGAEIESRQHGFLYIVNS